MNKNYILLAILLLILSGGLLLLPEKHYHAQISPETLMWDVVQPSRYVTSDQIAKMIIEKDPLLQIIDVRSEYDFAEFSLPGSINIPVDSIVTENANQILDIEDLNMVFVSDDDIKADQAWVLAKRLGHKNIYVMKGGLNGWISTIINPVPPAETASVTETDIYQFRKGASMYFTGAEISVDEPKQGFQITRRKKSSTVEGGC